MARTAGNGYERDPRIRAGILETAGALGMDPVDLATAISYETGGTFNPTQKGPTTQYGQHKGLIQFGQPQAKQHGVDWNDPIGSQLGQNGAVASYFRGAGYKPGMGMMDVYSAINAGRVGRYNASDANNGGAPGTVADKVNNQMAGHRKKAMALLGAVGDGEVPPVVSQAPSGSGAGPVRAPAGRSGQTYMQAYQSQTPSGDPSMGVATFKPFDDGFQASNTQVSSDDGNAAWSQLMERRAAEDQEPQEQAKRQYMLDILAQSQPDPNADPIYQAAVERAIRMATVPNSTRRA
jgi:hypothetical protein